MEFPNESKFSYSDVKNKELLTCYKCEKIIHESKYILSKIKIKLYIYIYIKLCTKCSETIKDL